MTFGIRHLNVYYTTNIPIVLISLNELLNIIVIFVKYKFLELSINFYSA